MFINPFALTRWGATDAEVAGSMPGDAHIDEPMFSATRSISIAAPPTDIFPWLRQMGYGRAGWYSYDWIDNLGRPSSREIHDKWQHLRQGGVVPGGPLQFIATIVEPYESFCILQTASRVRFTLAFHLRATADGTRLVSRARARLDVPLGDLLATKLLEPGDGLMVRKQLMGIKERAEAM
jgi:hypothetical protein